MRALYRLLPKRVASFPYPFPKVQSVAFMASETTKPIVIGLYGLPGCGKSSLLTKLQKVPFKCPPDFVEGSQEIASLLKDGLPEFDRLDDHEKTAIRERAAEELQQRSARTGRGVIVTGHYMFWDEKHTAGQVVCTTKDLQTYTHIIYLSTPAGLLLARRENDKLTMRKPCSAVHLQRWQQKEIGDLRRLCRDNHILFSVVENLDVLGRDLVAMIRHCRITETDELLEKIAREVVDAWRSRVGTLDQYLVFDADKTLSNADAGAMFWALHAESRKPASQAIPPDTTEVPAGQGCLLKELFGGPLGYSTRAFQQVSLMYENAVNEEDFNELCSRGASSIDIHEQLAELMYFARHRARVVIVTCGPARVWQFVLQHFEDFYPDVAIIGGGRIFDGFIVTPAVKAAIVSHLRDETGREVWAFGESPLDLPMLKAANHAVVVVGDEETRSRSMDDALSEAIADGALKARQLLLPDSVSPRLDEARLPLFTSDGFDALLYPPPTPSIFYGSKQAARLLMTPMRDAMIQGPALREAHRRTGWYLAMRMADQYLGVEEFAIQHRNPGQSRGFRLVNESQTCIVAIMRGGEQMAVGVNDAFPTATLLHAKTPDDLDAADLSVYEAIILVDSIINTGTTMISMVEHIRGRYGDRRIVIVTGGVQAEVLTPSNELWLMLCDDVSLVTLPDPDDGD